MPYNNSFLPALLLEPLAEEQQGTILLFGGFDSLIEEFFVIWKTLAEAGYRVIAFEGPGQGGARQIYGQLFDHDWEKPTAAILDYFDIVEAALVGISMGGYWSIRAAAYEPRIKQVVSWSPVYDWLEQIPHFTHSLLKQLLKWEGFMNATIRLRMRLIPILDHAVNHAMYISGGDTPMDGVYWMLGMNRNHISSANVTQDVLLMAGEDDSFQPPKLTAKQRDALINAQSISTQIFTSEEHASMHCQMGNLNLAISEIVTWLAEVQKLDKAKTT